MEYEEIAPDFEAGPLEELAQVLPAATVLELAASFYESVASCLAQLDAAAKASDWSLIKDQAHDLKGISGTFGASRLQQLAAELEHAIGMSSAQAAVTLREMYETFAAARKEIDAMLSTSKSEAA
ncbi:MAG TPA: Hpt domain-containing protein [Rhizomicrobium sp.]|nr:Hpt domain-containing protein [Rhizomicrobium sp.]